MAIRRLISLQRCRLFSIALLLLMGSAILPAQEETGEKHWSPDRALYAIRMPGEKVGKGIARERFGIYAANGKQISMIYIWETDPDGAVIAPEIRGCEKWGWIDASRLFCEGSSNPSTGVYRYFNARLGQEIGERVGSEFTWSPDISTIANFGNVPHFMDWDRKSDTLEIEKYRYPDKENGIRHLFRSQIAWSPDSRWAAIVDQECYQHACGFRLIVVRSKTGGQILCGLKYHEMDKEEWPGKHDFSLEWKETKIIVGLPSGGTEVVDIKDALRFLD
jgi:hypothetical protein